MNIERIARAMVEVEPSANLEARIRERLDRAPAPVASTWWSWKVTVPAIAAAALAIAAVTRGPASPVPGPAVASSKPAVALAPAAEIPQAPVTAAPPRASRRAQVARVLPTQLSAEELAWMERRVAALDPVTALEVDRLNVASIQPEPLAITPLVMTPVGTDGSGIERRNDR